MTAGHAYTDGHRNAAQQADARRAAWIAAYRQRLRAQIDARIADLERQVDLIEAEHLAGVGRRSA